MMEARELLESIHDDSRLRGWAPLKLGVDTDRETFLDIKSGVEEPK